jgi:hypothetical protein
VVAAPAAPETATPALAPSSSRGEHAVLTGACHLDRRTPTHRPRRLPRGSPATLSCPLWKRPTIGWRAVPTGPPGGPRGLVESGAVHGREGLPRPPRVLAVPIVVPHMVIVVSLTVRAASAGPPLRDGAESVGHGGGAVDTDGFGSLHPRYAAAPACAGRRAARRAWPAGRCRPAAGAPAAAAESPRTQTGPDRHQVQPDLGAPGGESLVHSPAAGGGARSNSAGQQLINPLLLQAEGATPGSATNHKHYCGDHRNSKSDGKRPDGLPFPFTAAAVIDRIVASKRADHELCPFLSIPSGQLRLKVLPLAAGLSDGSGYGLGEVVSDHAAALSDR